MADIFVLKVPLNTKQTNNYYDFLCVFHSKKMGIIV